jgi:lipoprotein-anchoring transpeptidase ErfK/SrfK
VQNRPPTLWRGLLGSTVMVVAAGTALVVVQPGNIVDGPADIASPGAVSYGPPRPWADRPAAAPVETMVESMSASPAGARPRPAVVRGSAETGLPSRSGSGRRIVYSISRQRVWLVRPSGRVERSYLVSGRRDQPGPGTYRVYSKSRHTQSAISSDRMEYMVRFTHGRRTGTAIGFHSIPVRLSTRKLIQQEAQLGQPLSAGCIRQRLEDAAYLWRFAPVGSKVVVTA